jgi:hypothetical protein
LRLKHEEELRREREGVGNPAVQRDDSRSYPPPLSEREQEQAPQRPRLKPLVARAKEMTKVVDAFKNVRVTSNLPGRENAEADSDTNSRADLFAPAPAVHTQVVDSSTTTTGDRLVMMKRRDDFDEEKRVLQMQAARAVQEADAAKRGIYKQIQQYH